MEFFELPLRITMALPHSVLFFSHAPPADGHFFGVTPPPFKRDIMIIKSDMHIFCSVQYDLYFLFDVKLLTTHSTDVLFNNKTSCQLYMN